MVKILHACFVREPGGIDRVFRDYTSALRALGAELHLLVPPETPLATYAANESLAHTCIANRRHLDVVAIYRIRKLIQREQPDAVIAQSNRAIALLRKAAWRLTPVIAVNHSDNIKRSIGANAVIAINPAMRARIVAAGQSDSRSFLVPNAIKLPGKIPQPSPIRTPPVIGAMGIFDENKNMKAFVEAVHLLREQGREIQAVLAGDGPEMDAIKALIQGYQLQDHITLPGWISGRDYENFWTGIDIFHLPSHKETFGMVLLEAMARNVPILASRNDGSEYVLKSGEYGALAEPTPEAIAAATGEMLDNWEQAQQRAVTASEEQLPEFGTEKLEKRLAEILQYLQAAKP